MKKFIYFVAAAIVAVACSKTYIGPKTTVVVTNGFIPYYSWNIPTNENGEAGIFFGNYVPATKATSENGHFVGPNECGYDSFSMFAFKDGVAVMNPYTVAWNGSMWSYETNTQELQYFDRNSEKYDFIGVIADNTTNDNGVIKVNAEAFMDNSNEMDTPKEVLYSITSVDKSGYNAPVSINFQHVNAKMYIGFASDKADTKIIDYAPGTSIWKQNARPFRAVAGDSNTGTKTPHSLMYNAITDEDITHVNQYKVTVTSNGKVYEPTDSWADYSGLVDATVEGDLDVNMWDYLVAKHPELANNGTEDLEWRQINDNVDKRVIHIERAQLGNQNIIYFWVINKNNTAIIINNGNSLTGIRVFSVDSDANGLVKTEHTTEALVSIENTCTLTSTASSGDVLEFAIPSSNVAQFATKDDVVVNDVTFSPSVYYTLPVNNPASGYVVKFSYTYDGTNYYDARVNIPAVDSNFEPGCYYKYVIYITDKTNGSTDPKDAITGKDDVDTTEKSISFVVTVVKYNKGVEEVYQL